MPTKIETKTNELCEAILEQIQTGGIRQRIDTFLADATARGQYESLMSKGQALAGKTAPRRDAGPGGNFRL